RCWIGGQSDRDSAGIEPGQDQFLGVLSRGRAAGCDYDFVGRGLDRLAGLLKSKHFCFEMIYPGGVIPWFAFFAGLLAGGLIAGLWMRARLARLEAARQFAECGATKLQETFQALADAA